MSPDPEALRILVPVNGTDDDGLALRVGAGIAKATAGIVHVVHAWHPMGVDASAFGATAAPPNDADVQQNAVALVTASRLAVDRIAGGRAIGHVEPAPATTAILDVADRIEPDLIVLTSRVRHGVAAALLGSVAQKVVDHSRWPALVLHGDEVQWPPDGIVVCYDGSEEATAALRLAGAIARRMDIRVRILQVIQRPAGREFDVDQAAWRYAAGQRLLAVLAEENLEERSMQIVAIGEVRHELDRLTRATHGDLVVLGTRGVGSSIPHTHIGSVATHVVRRGSGAFLVVPSQALAPTNA